MCIRDSPYILRSEALAERVVILGDAPAADKVLDLGIKQIIALA